MHRFLLGLAVLGQLVLIQGPDAHGTSDEGGIEFDFPAGILATQEDQSSVETPASVELSAPIDAGEPAAAGLRQRSEARSDRGLDDPLPDPAPVSRRMNRSMSVVDLEVSRASSGSARR